MENKKWYIIDQIIRTNECISVVELTEEQAEAFRYAVTHMKHVAGGDGTGVIYISDEGYDEKWHAEWQIIGDL